MHCATGDYESAKARLAQALELFRSDGDRVGEAECLNNTGEALLGASSDPEAQSIYEQALAIAREINAPIEEARALEGIGQCHLKNE